jgi:preprotein translocase subunit SecY
LLIFRVAATITVPGALLRDQNFLRDDQSSFLALMDLMGGGTIRRFSIVALGISPYITASILMTVLQSELFPPLYRMSQSGAAGRRKINIITR